MKKMTIQQMYNKYKSRYEECDAEWNKAYDELKTLDESPQKDTKRKSQLSENMFALNMQISAYECIVKDLKEYLDETSR